MNTKQRITILAGIALIALMLLVPPWKYYREGAAGYGLFFDPTIRMRFDIETFSIINSSYGNVYLDTTTLLIQCLIVALITGGLALLFQTRKS